MIRINKMKKICVITGSRSEYGLLYLLLKNIKNHKSLKLSLIATGSHLSSEYGSTYKEIIKDGFKIHSKINIIDNKEQLFPLVNQLA